MNKWTAWFDGACPGGRPCFGFILKRQEETKQAKGGPVTLLTEDQTTNVAEYGGLVEALKCAEKLVEPGDSLEVRGDSQLVIRQMLGQYRIKKEHLRPYAFAAMELIGAMRLKGVSILLTWIPREQNGEADRLSKKPVTPLTLAEVLPRNPVHTPEGKAFERIFKVSVLKFWEPLTGFDVIAFDEWAGTPEGVSCSDHVEQKFGQGAAAVVRAVL